MPCALSGGGPGGSGISGQGYQGVHPGLFRGGKGQGVPPLIELSETVRLIREHEAEYGVDPEKIAVCGFSAGGHLAASLGVLWNDPQLLRFMTTGAA